MKNHMKRTHINLSAITVSGLLALAFVIGWGTISGTEAASIIELSGTVRVKPTYFAPYQELYDTYAVKEGDIFHTSDESRLILRLLDNSHAILEPATVARFDGERFSCGHLTVFEGRLNSVVEKLDRDEHYSVSTPIATVGVRGTAFMVEVGATGSLVVDVSEGVVTAGSADEQAIIRAGEILKADPFTGFQPVTVAAAADLAAWHNIQQLCLESNAETVTEQFRPFIYRELGRIRVTFDDIMAIYKLHGELSAMVPTEEPARSDYYDSMAARLRHEAVTVYRKIIEGRGRIDAAAYTVEQLKEIHGVPAPWIDEAVAGYSNIWQGWINMIDGFMQMVESYEQMAQANRPDTAVTEP